MADPVEHAVRTVFADFDAGRFAEVAQRLASDAEMADELTGGWLRGQDQVAAYLDALTTQCSDVRSEVTAVRSRSLPNDLGTGTFLVHQRYRLRGEAREELLAGSASFRIVDEHAQLIVFHLGSTAPHVRVAQS